MICRKTINLIILIQVLLCCASKPMLAQKIQFKDGVIMKDKKPIAKLEGEATLGKDLDLKIISNAGTPLIILKEKVIKYNSSFYEDTHYILINMPSIEKTFTRVEMHDWASEKRIVKFFFDEIGDDFLSENGLNSEKVSAYILKGDDSKAIEKDTLALRELVNTFHRSLSEPLMKRNIRGLVELTPSDRSKTKWKKYVSASGFFRWEVSIITQANVQIGLLIKAMGAHPQYYVLRKVNKFKTSEYEDEFVPLALLDTQWGELSQAFYVERFPGIKKPKIQNPENAEYTFIQFLINEGVL